MDAGDDFLLTAGNVESSGGLSSVSTNKRTVGIDYAVCTGTKVIPSTGTPLTKGQPYFVRVFALNRIGFSEAGVASTSEKPMVVPGLPTGVILQVTSVSELRVLFSPPDDSGGDVIDKYKIEWSISAAFDTFDSSTMSYLNGGAPFFKMIRGLTKGTSYYVRVKAKNSQGYGIGQSSSPLSLNPHTVPSAPTNVNLGVTAKSMLTVQWDIPSDNGGDVITSYVVEWDTVNSFNSMELAPHKNSVTIDDTAQTSYTLTGLTPSQVYYARVKAVNSKGAGAHQVTVPPSAITINMRPGKPHTLSVVPTTTSGELVVSWQAPRIPFHGYPCSGNMLQPRDCPNANGFDAALGGSNLIKYEIQWSENSDFSGSTSESTTSTSFTLGLTANTKYYVRVVAKNAQGYSAYCATKNDEQGYLCPGTGTQVSGTTK